MRRFALTLALSAATAHAEGSTSSHTEPSNVAGGVAAGGVLASLVVLSSISKPSNFRGAENADCIRDTDCTAGHYCAPRRNQCVRRDDVATSQRAEAIELWLRAQVIELREELALGRGVVIAGLSRAQHVPEPTLGRVLKQHRAVLLAEIGDGSDPKWAARFLRRLDGLVVSSSPT